jgi:hypothetical protein
VRAFETEVVAEEGPRRKRRSGRILKELVGFCDRMVVVIEVGE